MKKILIIVGGIVIVVAIAITAYVAYVYNQFNTGPDLESGDVAAVSTSGNPYDDYSNPFE